MTARLGVIAFFPQARIVALADERTEGIASAYRELAAKASTWPRQVQLMNALRQSCYLQGLHDAIDAAVRMEHRQE